MSPAAFKVASVGCLPILKPSGTRLPGKVADLEYPLTFLGALL